MMNIIIRLNIYFNYKYIDEDQFGNRYYEAKIVKNIDTNQKKRLVFYKGLNEPSKVPPKFHAWLHYLISTDDLQDTKNLPRYKWQKERMPNATGTYFAKFPSGHISYGQKRNRVSSDYNAWQPELSNNKNE